MAFVSTEIKNLVFAMNNNVELFASKIIKLYSHEEIEALVSRIKFELSTSFISEEDADSLYLLQLILENA